MPVDASLRQPAASPNPCGEHAINKWSESGIQAEIAPIPTLRHGAGRNGDAGLHKDRFKKEERQESHVVKDLGQEKASGSDDAVFESAVIAESNERSHYICAARRGAMG
jgi:hypothetical protein